jgi:hypothetical protein
MGVPQNVSLLTQQAGLGHSVLGNQGRQRLPLGDKHQERILAAGCSPPGNHHHHRGDRLGKQSEHRSYELWEQTHTVSWSFSAGICGDQ